jgi:hypothetical protein
MPVPFRLGIGSIFGMGKPDDSLTIIWRAVLIASGDGGSGNSASAAIRSNASGIHEANMGNPAKRGHRPRLHSQGRRPVITVRMS